ncbi:MAG: hypothetical protein AVDCRST_MAG86-2119 [uncultured Truepera sp.]|uniref:N-acetyltransferase domain-containing protein n=1 Tax=uncultured Truepera sp. TaxID=543023 RepID=A0A6J4VIA1_9DEIN|nr:MAG: hypothetical protein AVDCRST_MAG86-2119 [uncultured Truepera sp.]
MRPLTSDDLPHADALFNAAYGRRGGLGEAGRRYLAWQPDGWLLAELSGQPVGMVYAVRYDRFAYVGVMAVPPSAQRRGVGRALMTRLLTDLEAHAVGTVRLDATPEGAALYRHFGFVEEGTKTLYRRAEAVRGELVGMRPLRRGDLLALTAFDAPKFGAARDHVLRTLCEAYPERAFVSRRAGGVSGYVVASPRSIGPWVADDSRTAEQLLLCALALPFETEPSVIAPDANTAAGTLLARYGFRVVRRTVHMRRGSETPIDYAKLYAQVSFAVG